MREHFAPEKCPDLRRNDTLLVKYLYLSDGMKTGARNSSGQGLEYRGTMTFRRDAQGTLTFESVPFVAGRMTAKSPTVQKELTKDVSREMKSAGRSTAEKSTRQAINHTVAEKTKTLIDLDQAIIELSEKTVDETKQLLFQLGDYHINLDYEY